MSVSPAVQGKKKSLLLWNSVRLFVLFPSLLPLWAYRKAWVRRIPGDAKSRHEKDKQHLFTLKKNANRIGRCGKHIARAGWAKSSEVPLSHCNPIYEEVLENPCKAYFAYTVCVHFRERNSCRSEVSIHKINREPFFQLQYHFCTKNVLLNENIFGVSPAFAKIGLFFFR